MKSYHLIFLSKNKNSLNKNFLFLLNNPYFNNNTVKKHFTKKTKKQFLTLLKSPHVNKKAQEQFENHFFSKQLTICSTQKLKHMFLLKKIKNNLFANVQLKVKFSLNKKREKDVNSSVFDLNNFQINIGHNFVSQSSNLKKKKNNYNINNKKIKFFLQVTDTYGELNIGNCLGSSVGRAKD